MVFTLNHACLPNLIEMDAHKESFDWGMHYLRAFAIVCILLEHLWWYIGLYEEARAYLHGSSIYFLFISGYLCQHLSARRPSSAKTYYRRKIENIISPYLMWSLLTILFVWITGQTRIGVISPDKICWANLPRILLLGWAQGPYWYIPFVSGLFLVSPSLTRIGDARMLHVFLVSFALAVCIPIRPWSEEFIPYVLRYSYFGWSYFLGFLYARFKGRIDPFLNLYVGPALVLGILLGLRLQQPDWFIFGYPSYDSPEPDSIAFILGGSLAQSLQKLFFLVPAVALSNRLTRKRIPILDWLATYSFTLYFTHHFFVQDFVRLQNSLFTVLEPGPIGILPIQLGLSALFIAFNLVLAMALKGLFGRWSRRFIGA